MTRFSAWEGMRLLRQDERFLLHHSRTGKHLPRLLLPPRVGELRVDARVLNVRVPQPVLNERQVCAGVQQMRSDGVLQAMEVLFLGREFRLLTVSAHEFVKRRPVNQQVTPRRKEIG